MKNKYRQNIEQEARAMQPTFFKSKTELELELKKYKFLSYDNKKDITRSVRAKTRAIFNKNLQNIELEKQMDIKRESAKVKLAAAKKDFLNKLNNEELELFLKTEKRRGEISGNEFKSEKARLNKVLNDFYKRFNFNYSIYHYYN